MPIGVVCKYSSSRERESIVGEVKAYGIGNLSYGITVPKLNMLPLP